MLLDCNYQQHSPLSHLSIQVLSDFLRSNAEHTLFGYNHLDVLPLPGEEK